MFVPWIVSVGVLAVGPQDPPPSPDVASLLSRLREELAAAQAELIVLRGALAPDAGERAADADPAEPPLAAASTPRWQLLGDADSSWRVGGWLAQGGTWNPSAPRDHWNGTVSWMDRANEYELTELYVTVERRAGRPANGFDVGGRVDAMWGTNYRFVTSAGFESTWNEDDRYGVALPSAYLEFTTARTSTIVGRFISPVGYFIVGTANNFFSTLPYTFAFGEPFTHTGVMTTVDVAADLQVRVGLTNGWDSTADWNSQRAGLVDEAWNRHVGALGMVTVGGLLAEGDSLAWFGSWSLEPDLSGLGRSSRYLQSLVYTLPLAPSWQWVAQSDFGFQHAAVPDPAGGREDAEWFGLNQYLFHDASVDWRWGLALEWFRDDDGARVASPVPSFGSPNGQAFGRGPFAGDFFRATIGPRWQPHPNVWLRPAVLCDVFDGHRSGGLLPFDDGHDRVQWLANLELLLFF